MERVSWTMMFLSLGLTLTAPAPAVPWFGLATIGWAVSAWVGMMLRRVNEPRRPDDGSAD